MMGNRDIDVVVTWVDGNDPEWLKEKNKYRPGKAQDGGANRFRDWDLMRYWFRGIETNATWVRNIYFVTWGHLPSWLDTSNPRLKIINHTDFIPEKYLPTFSSRTIELNFHRIKGLSEQFVYFNDDMFLLQPTVAEDFFVKGLPKSMGVFHPISYDNWTLGLYTKLNELVVIGRNFDKRKVVSENRSKFFSLKYGKFLLENVADQLYRNFTGFRNTHSPYPLLKQTYAELWDKEFSVLDQTCRDRFRSNQGVNSWLVKQWQICKGNFVPCNEMAMSKTLSLGTDDREIDAVTTNSKYKTVCISDDDPNLDFDEEKAFIDKCFLRMFPQKSSFEK